MLAAKQPPTHRQRKAGAKRTACGRHFGTAPTTKGKDMKTRRTAAYREKRKSSDGRQGSAPEALLWKRRGRQG